MIIILKIKAFLRMNNMKITRRKLKRLIEMAVRQDIIDAAAAQPRKRTVLMRTALDVKKLDDIYQRGFGDSVKPTGLWYGFGTNWIDFVRNPDNKGLIQKYTTPEYFYNIDGQREGEPEGFVNEIDNILGIFNVNF